MAACLQVAEDVVFMSSDRKVILITGANRGIGKEIARQMAENDWQVIVAARDLSNANKVVKAIGRDAFGLQLDVQDEHSVREAALIVDEKFKKLDVLVNNAGIFGNNSILDFDLEQIRVVMDTNLMGSIRTSKYFMPLLKKSDDGRIINMSSGLGQLDSLKTGGYGAYRLSKTALNALTIMMASEVERVGIKVFSMSPGWVKTDMGGKNAPRSVEKGAETAIWLALEKNIVSGKFYQDMKVIDW
jgi:NAD(P)-dependent dehydrogenase (short-subunit alcohol dehydrogenase family)